MGGCICSSFDWNGDFSAIIKGSRKTAFFTLKILICCDILSFDKNRGRKLFMKKIICIIETVLAILMIAVLIFGIKNGVRFIAASFLSCNHDLVDFSTFLKENDCENIDIIV